MVEVIVGTILGNLLLVMLVLFTLGFTAYRSDRGDTPWYMFIVIVLGLLFIPKVILGYNLVAFGMTIPGWKAAIGYFTIAATIAVIQMRVYDVDAITTKATLRFCNGDRYPAGFAYRWVAEISRASRENFTDGIAALNIRIWWFGVFGYFIQYMIIAPVLVIDWFIGDVVKKAFIRMSQHLREVLITRITNAISVKMNAK